MIIVIKYITFFLAGILECFGIAINNKFLIKNKKIPCFITSFINILVWYYILATIIDNVHEISIIIVYALGFAIGDVSAIFFDKYLERLAKSKGLKILRRIKHKRRKRNKK